MKLRTLPFETFPFLALAVDGSQLYSAGREPTGGDNAADCLIRGLCLVPYVHA